MQKTIGIDPDSEKNGVSLYVDGELKSLHNLKFIELQAFLLENKDALVAIENVMCNTSTFKKPFAMSELAIRKVAHSVGRCAQVGYHIVEFCEYHNIRYILIPISKAWKKQKSIFERITGWTKQSNEDTRSAAYVGYLGAQRHGRITQKSNVRVGTHKNGR